MASSDKGPQSALIDQMKEILTLYGISLSPEALSDENDGTVDYAQVLSKTQDKIEELNQQAEVIAKNMGMSRDDLEAFANNPNNFTQEQWEMLQRVRQECENFKNRTIKALGQAGAFARGEEPKKVPAEKKEKQKLGKKKKWLQL